MKRSHRWLFALVVLVVATVAGVAFAPSLADAGMLCHDGRWISSDQHCQLGTLVNCTECWVWPK